jgi:hypothetical protein
MPTSNEEPFVKRFEMAVMQYVILDKAKQGEVTRENLKQSFRGNLQMSSDHFDHCIDLLVEDGHLEKVGDNKFKASDDGREDVQKLQTLVLELPNVIHQGGKTQQQGMRQTAGGGGGSTGSTIGTQPDVGTSRPQGQTTGSQQGNTQPGKISGQSGVSGQRRTADVEKGGATRE